MADAVGILDIKTLNILLSFTKSFDNIEKLSLSKGNDIFKGGVVELTNAPL